MSDYRRDYPRLSLCGLNCGLCPRYHTDGTSRCPGCCGEGFLSKRPACGVITCARGRGVAYCYECDDYPCRRLQGAECTDSFITHRNMRVDFDTAERDGIEAYRAMLDEKVAMLQTLLTDYNDGRRKKIFCLAVNLLDVQAVREVMARLAAEVGEEDPPKARAAAAEALLRQAADGAGIVLELNTGKRG